MCRPGRRGRAIPQLHPSIFRYRVVLLGGWSARTLSFDGEALMYKVKGQTLGDYYRKTFILPTSTASVAPAVSLMVSKKKCGCGGHCGPCQKQGHGLNSPQMPRHRQRLSSGARTSFPPRLKGLGDDGDLSDDWSDSTVFNTPNLVASPDYPGVDLASTGIPVFGPQPTQDTLTYNAATGLAPGTVGTSITPVTSGQNVYGGVVTPATSGIASVIASIFSGATKPATPTL